MYILIGKRCRSASIHSPIIFKSRRITFTIDNQGARPALYTRTSPNQVSHSGRLVAHLRLRT